MKILMDYHDALEGYTYNSSNNTYTPLRQSGLEIKQLANKSHYDNNIPLIAEEIPSGDSNLYIEGSIKTIIVNAYERDVRARQVCVEHYRSLCGNRVICWICGFDFRKFYGDGMVDRIHVHHIKPLGEIKAEYHVDPIIDLIPICPNCHYAVHVLDCTPDYLKELLAKK